MLHTRSSRLLLNCVQDGSETPRLIVAASSGRVVSFDISRASQVWSEDGVVSGCAASVRTCCTCCVPPAPQHALRFIAPVRKYVLCTVVYAGFGGLAARGGVDVQALSAAICC